MSVVLPIRSTFNQYLRFFHLLYGDRGSLVRDSSGHCVDSLSKTLLYNLLSTGSTKEDRRKSEVVIEKMLNGTQSINASIHVTY